MAQPRPRPWSSVAAGGVRRARGRARGRRLRQPRRCRSCCASTGSSGRDAAFTTELVGGTLRVAGHATTPSSTPASPAAKPEAEVRDALRLGAHQLLAMRVPDHAAVTQHRRAGPRPGRPQAGGLHQRRDAPDRRADLDAGWTRPRRADPVGYARRALPPAVGRRGARRGAGPARRAGRAAGRRQRRAEGDAGGPAGPVHGRGAGGCGRPARHLSPYGRRCWTGGDPGASRPSAEGRAGVQDEGSQLVALALAEAERRGRDERWLDLCAGPGGKAALLAALATERGARLLANERQPHRATAGRARPCGADRLSGVVTGDGTRPPWREGTFDRVLVDAPCSGLGALRRRPETRWRRTPQDLDDLVPLQRALLDTASTRCDPAAWSSSTRPARRCWPRPPGSWRPCWPTADDAHLECTRQLWPHREGTDAMFLATIRRPEARLRVFAIPTFSVCSVPHGAWMMDSGGPVEVIGTRGIESVSASSNKSRSRRCGPALTTVRVGRAGG